MNTRRVLWLTFLILLLTLMPLVGVGILQAASDPQPRPIEPPTAPVAPVVRAAQPRAGILSNTQGDAANLMSSWTTTDQEPLTTLLVGQPIVFQSDYEAVIFRGASGAAHFELAIYRLLSNGDRELLGADRRAHAGSGPRRMPGVITVTVALQKPGVHQLAIVSRSTARPAEADPVVVENDVIVHVRVGDVSLLPHTPMPPPSRDVERLPMPIERQMVVASPRGHLLSGGVGAAENFPQNHGRVVYLRQGQSLTLASRYEFVWFAGASGVASTELAVSVQGLTDGQSADEEIVREAGGAWRLAGVLEVEIPFSMSGRYEVQARLRTQVAPENSMARAIPIAEDVVRISVVVMAEPQVGAITGLVLDRDDGSALQRVAVRAVDAETGAGGARILGTAYSDEDGRYLIDSLAPGKYLVQAEPLAQNYMPGWWQDKPTREEADAVEVVAQTMVEGIDFRLAPGGVISGRVVEDDPDSTLPVIKPLGGVLVVAGRFEDDGAVPSAIVAKTRTLRDGSYRLDRLPQGAYWVYAGDASWVSSEEAVYRTLIGKYWDDHLRREDANPVRVAAGQEVDEINFALQYAGTITGRAVGVGVTPVIVPLKVTAFDWASGEAVRTVAVGPQGVYRIPSLPAGRYRVYASDERGYFVPQYYDGVTDPAQATPVDARRGEVTKGIDFVLAMAGVTTLKIEPLMTTVRPGEEFTVTVEVADVSDLGAFSVELSWGADVGRDAAHPAPAIVEVLGVELGEFLGSTGRTIVPVGPNIDPAAGLLEYGAVSVGDAPGAQGAGVLARVHMRALQAGETALMLPSAKLTNTAAEELSHVLRGARVMVADACIFGDVNCDCVVDIVDIMLVAARWGARQGDPEYDPLYDLDKDGDIDIIDLALVAAAWGNTCDQDTRPLRPTLRGAHPAMSGASLRLEPALSQVALGEPIMLAVWIDGAQDLGAFQVTVSYDATKVALASNGVSLGGLIESSGRSATLLEPRIEVDGAEGMATVGAFTLGSSIPGANGSGVLVHMSFVPLAAGEVAFDLHDARVTDTVGQAQESVGLEGGVVTIVRGAGGASFLPFIRR